MIHQTAGRLGSARHHSPIEIALASVGVSLAILSLAWVTSLANLVLVLGSFGSSCVLLFAFPRAPVSQPRNFVAGHFLSSLVGLIFLHWIGPQWWTMALATGVATAIMMLTNTLHPPAGSNPLIIYLVHPSWSFLWFPTLAGAVVVQAVAIVYHRLVRRNKYPAYWYRACHSVKQQQDEW